jgi:ketosteroid isomerase-like protein
MAQGNVEIVRRWNASYNQRDMDALIKLTDPELEFRSVFLAMESTFRGHEGLSAYFKAVEDAYERFEVVPEDYLDAGAAVLILCRIEWRGKGSGAEGKVPLAVCAWLKAGRIFHIESYTDRSDGFRAVGLSEQDAHAGP